MGIFQNLQCFPHYNNVDFNLLRMDANFNNRKSYIKFLSRNSKLSKRKYSMFSFNIPITKN